MRPCPSECLCLCSSLTKKAAVTQMPCVVCTLCAYGGRTKNETAENIDAHRNQKWIRNELYLKWSFFPGVEQTRLPVLLLTCLQKCDQTFADWVVQPKLANRLTQFSKMPKHFTTLRSVSQLYILSDGLVINIKQRFIPLCCYHTDVSGEWVLLMQASAPWE